VAGRFPKDALGLSHNGRAAADLSRGAKRFLNDIGMLLICPADQTDFGRVQYRSQMARRSTMYIVAGILVVLSGLFYAAGHHEIGSMGVEMCRYGGVFCDSPHYVLTAAGLAAAWGTFVSIK
jgi:hypothetical protein